MSNDTSRKHLVPCLPQEVREWLLGGQKGFRIRLSWTAVATSAAGGQEKLLLSALKKVIQTSICA